jgi:hypothetical protein
MKSVTLRKLIISQIFIILLFLCLTLGNEILDIPHYIFNDAPTLHTQRTGEVWIELSIFSIIISTEIFLFYKLFKRVRILEGFLPICANCKKIRNAEDQWEEIEKYITQNSLAQFSHSICPNCAKQLYPEFENDKI